MAAVLGPAGVVAYRDNLRHGLDAANTQVTAWRHVPGWLPGFPIAGAIVALVAVAAAFDGRRRYGRAVAAAVCASLLGTPYLFTHDQGLLVVAGWLVLRDDPPRWVGWGLLASYPVVLIDARPESRLLLEAFWLVVLAAMAVRGDRARRLTPGVPAPTRPAEA
jgi:hypothetical protein